MSPEVRRESILKGSHTTAGSELQRLNSLRENSMVRHSEERSDEESLILLAIIQEGFLAEFTPAPCRGSE